MTLEQLLKDQPDALKIVNDTIKSANDDIVDSSKKIKFVDLGDGEYVSSKKYTDIEKKFNDLKESPNEFETKYNNLLAEKETELSTEKSKLTEVIKKMAIDNAVSSLGIKDKLTETGIKALIKTDDIKIGDDYSVTSGLSEQIDAIKTTYKDSFIAPTVVSTGSKVQTSSTVNTARKYNSLAEIKALTQEEVNADIVNITEQLPSLS